ncbi:MAG: hypothetical protein U0992_06700 [Planctomycetaceae bacterium]
MDPRHLPQTPGICLAGRIRRLFSQQVTGRNRKEAYATQTAHQPEPVELWRWLLLAVLAGLVLETFMTRRLVRRGHMDVEEAVAA